MAEVKPKLLEAARAFWNSGTLSNTVYPTVTDMLTFAAAFAQEREDAVREDCCKKVCWICAEGTAAGEPAIEYRTGEWRHKMRSGNSQLCEAAAIRGGKK